MIQANTNTLFVSLFATGSALNLGAPEGYFAAGIGAHLSDNFAGGTSDLGRYLLEEFESLIDAYSCLIEVRILNYADLLLHLLILIYN